MKSKKILCKSRYSRIWFAVLSLGLIISFLIPSFCGCNMLPANPGEITYTKPKA